LQEIFEAVYINSVNEFCTLYFNSGHRQGNLTLLFPAFSCFSFEKLDLHIRNETCYALPTRRSYQRMRYYYLIFLSGLFCPYNVSVCIFYVPKYQFVTVISVFAGSNWDQSSRVFSDFCSCSFRLQQANPLYHSWALCCIMSVIISFYVQELLPF